MTRVIDVQAKELVVCCLLGPPVVLRTHWVNGRQICLDQSGTGSGCPHCPSKYYRNGYPPAALEHQSTGQELFVPRSDRYRELCAIWMHGKEPRNWPNELFGLAGCLTKKGLEAREEMRVIREAEIQERQAVAEVVIPQLTDGALTKLQQAVRRWRGTWIRLMRARSVNNSPLVPTVLDRPPLRSLPEAFDVRPSVCRFLRIASWPAGAVALAEPQNEQRRQA